MIVDIYNRKIEVGDIVVRPIHKTSLRAGKVLAIEDDKITLSVHKKEQTRYDNGLRRIKTYTFITNEQDITKHNDSMTYGKSNIPVMVIILKGSKNE